MVPSSHTFGHAGPRGPCGQLRLLKNGAAAHEFTRQDRAKGGRARAETIRRRKELRARFEVDELEELADAEFELVDRALVRLALLISSDDDRVALRACLEVFDRVLGRSQPAASVVERDYQAEIKSSREKLAILIERRARAIAESRIPEGGA